MAPSPGCVAALGCTTNFNRTNRLTRRSSSPGRGSPIQALSKTPMPHSSTRMGLTMTMGPGMSPRSPLARRRPSGSSSRSRPHGSRCAQRLTARAKASRSAADSASRTTGTLQGSSTGTGTSRTTGTLLGSSKASHPLPTASHTPAHTPHRRMELRSVRSTPPAALATLPAAATLAPSPVSVVQMFHCFGSPPMRGTTSLSPAAPVDNLMLQTVRADVGSRGRPLQATTADAGGRGHRGTLTSARPQLRRSTRPTPQSRLSSPRCIE